MLYVIFFLVGCCVIAAAHFIKRRGIPAAPAAGWTAFMSEIFAGIGDNLLTLLLALVVLGFSFYMLKSVFPGSIEWYVGMGPPTWSLFAIAVLIVVIAMTMTGTRRKWRKGLIWLTLAVPVFMVLSVPCEWAYTWWQKPWSSSGAAVPAYVPLIPRERSVAGLWCNGRPVDGLPLKAGETMTVNWGDYCHVDLRVVRGRIKIGSNKGGFKEVGPEGLGELAGFPIVEFQAVTDATVNYVLCPSKTKYDVDRCS